MHFYSKDAEPKFFVEMKTRPGELRPTRTADAKKEGWVPSVTTILNVLDKPALVNWKVGQYVRQAYTLNPADYQTVDLFLDAVRYKADQEMDKAPSAGTDVHSSLEKYFLGETPEDHLDICLSVERAIISNTGYARDDFSTERRFSHNLGYAGMVDLSNRWWVIDFKTKQTADKFKPGKMVYPEHCRQLAAYRHGLQTPSATCANIFICIESGEIDFHIHKEPDLEKGLGTFLDSLSIWKREHFDSAYS